MVSSWGKGSRDEQKMEDMNMNISTDTEFRVAYNSPKRLDRAIPSQYPENMTWILPGDPFDEVANVYLTLTHSNWDKFCSTMPKITSNRNKFTPRPREEGIFYSNNVMIQLMQRNTKGGPNTSTENASSLFTRS